MFCRRAAKLFAVRQPRFFLGVEKFIHSSALRSAAIHDNNDYTKLLYTRLSEQHPQYQFLDPSLEYMEPSCPELTKQLLSVIRNDEESTEKVDELHGELLEKFQDWAKHSQLRIGYLMHIDNRIHSKEYITRVIKHMGLEDPYKLAPDEMITLLLLIYFRKDSSLEDLSLYLDLDSVQGAFAAMIQSQSVSPEEICAGCLGLKKINDLKININILRISLYDKLDCQGVDANFKDFYLMTLLTTLSKGNYIFNDPPNLINKGLQSLYNNIGDVSLMTSIKVLGFGLPASIINQNMSDYVVKRVLEDIDSVSLKDTMGLIIIFSKSKNENTDLLVKLMMRLNMYFNQATTVSEIVDILNCLYFLSFRNLYNLKLFRPIHTSMCSVPTQHIAERDQAAIGQHLVTKLVQDHPNKQMLLDNLKLVGQDMKMMSTICRIPAFLAVSLRLDKLGNEEEEEETSQLNMALSGDILGMYHSKLPMALFSPHANIQALDNRNRLLVNCYRSVVKLLRNEKNVTIARILPHFSEPDVIFGQLGGISLSAPDYITDVNLLRPKKAPTGDWYVLIMATRKTINADQELIGPEQVKVRQLVKLGYNPIIIPYSDMTLGGDAKDSLSSILQLHDVSLKGTDDGLLGSNPKVF